MIERLKVDGLNGKLDAGLEFNSDLNIITGANGSGKTTLLKLTWYLISGQIDRALYIWFDRVSIGTDQFELSISSNPQDEFEIEWSFGKSDNKESLYFRFEDAEDACYSLKQNIAEKMKGSLFFPSFRRIEGGFSQILPDNRSIRQARRTGNSIRAHIRELSPFQGAMSQMSVEQSIADHKFVTSFSTTDIVELLPQKDTEISEEINAKYADLSRDLAEKIPPHGTVVSALEHIREDLNKAGTKEKELRKPLEFLDESIDKIFSHGITITKGFTLGNKNNAISSEKLSYGEQQMLSFLCYNAFSRDTLIFIDEPELSLHIDWQRLLLPILLAQGTGNQFFIVTHSPFILSRYPHKEILLGDNRGDEGGESDVIIRA